MRITTGSKGEQLVVRPHLELALLLVDWICGGELKLISSVSLHLDSWPSLLREGSKEPDRFRHALELAR